MAKHVPGPTRDPLDLGGSRTLSQHYLGQEKCYQVIAFTVRLEFIHTHYRSSTHASFVFQAMEGMAKRMAAYNPSRFVYHETVIANYIEYF
jgi:hypothetical protein